MTNRPTPTAPTFEVANGEHVKDDFDQRIANEMAASDACFAETAREITGSDVIGIDGEL